VRIVDSGEIADGTALEFSAPGDVSAEDRARLDAWLGEAPNRRLAKWRNDRPHPIEWTADGKRYRPTPLVREILGQAGLEDRPISGSSWWTLPEGTTLAQIAARVAGGFDWSSLHAILFQLPGARWTTYGDLAQAVGTGAMALGQHIAACSQCENAWRVLGADGRPRVGFQWSDKTRTESQQDVLIAEGVTFAAGRADDHQRMKSAELAALANSDAET
jgi:alkylated DNA nucleotide flippase Atl1